MFNDLKARGIQDILILCRDGLTGLPEAVVAANDVLWSTRFQYTRLFTYDLERRPNTCLREIIGDA